MPASFHSPARGTLIANDRMWPDWIIDSNKCGTKRQSYFVRHRRSNWFTGNAESVQGHFFLLVAQSKSQWRRRRTVHFADEIKIIWTNASPWKYMLDLHAWKSSMFLYLYVCLLHPISINYPWLSPWLSLSTTCTLFDRLGTPQGQVSRKWGIGLRPWIGNNLRGSWTRECAGFEKVWPWPAERNMEE